MELSSPSNPDVETGLRPSRRKSGRATKQTEVLDPSDGMGSKRKHNSLSGTSAAESEEDNDDEPDEEELRERNRKARKTAPKRAIVKNKTLNGSMPVRPAPSRAKKTKRAAGFAGAQDVGGLYGELFGDGEHVDKVAADWCRRFDAHQANALTEVVNLVLRSTGCEEEVEVWAIEDPDNAPDRLSEMQAAFQEKTQTEYPIISKAKGTADFKRTLLGFFESLVITLAAKGTLYSETDLMTNIEVWIAAMSSGSNRPFRHTATVIALALIDGLSAVGKALVQSQAKWQRQAEGEEKKAKVNHARVNDLKRNAEADSQNMEAVDSIAKNLFDSVFVHRYRDVDERIRLECILHLGQWIGTYPQMFLEGTYVRYLAWQLSDHTTAPRHEAVKQLHKIYKDDDKITAMHAMTDKFKDRMIEMAMRDSDIGIRASIIELLDTLRAAGVLEPNDIDAIGRLIFDVEPRVRKAVVPFFVASVQDSFSDMKDDLGGDDQLAELPDSWTGEDDPEHSCIEWLKFKALAELYESFEPEELPPNIEAESGNWHEKLVASGVESHFSIAAHSLLTTDPALIDWHQLANYLLWDSSATRSRNPDTADLEKNFTTALALNAKEEAVLLDLLNVAVKLDVTDIVEGKPDKSKKSKKEQQLLFDKQEEAAQVLARDIPRLLNKYGASPQAASAVLRLQRTLRLDVFQELREDSTTYAALLDDVAKQFNSHKTPEVLQEASSALMHARQFQGLDEITEERLQSLWDDTTYDLVKHCRGEELDLRGAIDLSTLVQISNTVLHLVSLARKCDCVTAFLSPKTYRSANARRKTGSEPPVIPLSLLLALVNRGKPVTSIESEVDAAEAELVANTTNAILCYFMWQAHHLRTKSAAEAGNQEDLANAFSDFSTSLYTIMHSRQGADTTRIQAADDLLSLHATFSQQGEANTAFTAFQQKLEPLPPVVLTLLLNVFTAVERDYARKIKKKLDEPSEDDDPEDSDAESEADDEEEPANEQAAVKWRYQKEQRQRSVLLAEHRLCTLTGHFVMAMLAGAVQDEEVLEDSAVRARLVKNKGRLGPNFAQVLALLDEPAKLRKAAEKKAKDAKRKVKAAQTAKATTSAAKKGKAMKSKELIIDDEDDEADDAMMANGDHEDDGETLRQKGLIVDEELPAGDLDADPIDDESNIGD